MNWHKTLYDIYEKLKTNGYEDISESLHKEQLKGATGGEILDLMLSALTVLKKQNPHAFAVIRSEADELFAFAKSIGYI